MRLSRSLVIVARFPRLYTVADTVSFLQSNHSLLSTFHYVKRYITVVWYVRETSECSPRRGRSEFSEEIYVF